jgi:prophage regulatory protein
MTYCERILRINEVSKISGLPVSSIYRLVREGKFPKPVKLSARASGWISSNVQDWINDLSSCQTLEG